MYAIFISIEGACSPHYNPTAADNIQIACAQLYRDKPVVVVAEAANGPDEPGGCI